jgi:hypothetical protein
MSSPKTSLDLGARDRAPRRGDALRKLDPRVMAATR